MTAVHAQAHRTAREINSRRSELARAMKERLPVLRDIVIVDDKQIDADVMASNIRKLLGYEMSIRIGRNITDAVRLVSKPNPDLLLLDDRLGHSGRACSNVPVLRRAGYLGPVVIFSDGLNTPRRWELKRVGVAASMHKDEIEGARLAEVLLSVFSTPTT